MKLYTAVLLLGLTNTNKCASAAHVNDLTYPSNNPKIVSENIEGAHKKAAHTRLLLRKGVVVGVDKDHNPHPMQMSAMRHLQSDISTYEQRGIDIDGEAAYDTFGTSVTMSSNGEIIAVGASRNDGNGSRSGHIRVFHFDGTTHVQRGIDIDGEVANDQFGWSVSMSSDGDIIAVGARENDGNGSNSGHVRVFQFDGSTYIQRGVDIDGEAAYDLFGHSVTMSSDGDIIAVGASGNDGNGSNSGHVRVFQFDGSTYLQRGIDIDGEVANDQFGTSVTMSDDGGVIAIGAPNNDGSGTDSGHVRVFQFDGSTYVQRSIDIDGEAAGDNFGRDVTMSSNGEIIAVGAPRNDGNGLFSGHVRVFQFDGSTYIQRGIDIEGEVAYTGLGNAVTMSSDGGVIAVGAPYDRNSGRVRVFHFDGTNYIQRGIDLEGKGYCDQFGWSVSMSSDGDVIAVGAPGDGDDNGNVRVFQLPSPPSPQELLDEIIVDLVSVSGDNQDNTLNGALKSALNFLGKSSDADTNYTKMRKAIDASEALGCDPFEYTDSEPFFSICESISKVISLLALGFPQ